MGLEGLYYVGHYVQECLLDGGDPEHGGLPGVEDPEH